MAVGKQLARPGRIRTRDPRFRRPMLYPLSYGRVLCKRLLVVRSVGLRQGVSAVISDAALGDSAKIRDYPQCGRDPGQLGGVAFFLVVVASAPGNVGRDGVSEGI